MSRYEIRVHFEQMVQIKKRGTVHILERERTSKHHHLPFKGSWITVVEL